MDILVTAASNNGNKSNQQTAVDKVTEYIKNKVIYKELHSGDKIPTESELCKILNVSRSSVREALKVLEAINIIQIRRGDGTYISEPKDISFSEALLFKMILNDMRLEELLDFREQMEFTIIKLAITYATYEDIKKLKNNIIEMKNCIKDTPEDYERLHLLDIEFHNILVKATYNSLMEELYLFTMKIFSPIILGNYEIGQGGDLTLVTHEATILAIEKRDFYAAGHAVKLSVDLWAQWMDKQNKPTFKR